MLALVSSALAVCWASVADGGPTFSQHWANVSCLIVEREPDINPADV